MLIRQNPLQQTAFDPETAHLCARIAREIIHNHEVFLARYPGARASGYFITSSMVECVYHLVPVLHYSKDPDEHGASLLALKRAHNILIQLSSILNVSKNALRALRGVMSRWGTQSNTQGHDSSGFPDNCEERIHGGVSESNSSGAFYVGVYF